MILSRKYGFIFIKTGKVGGTSLEIALAKHLGPQDVITPIKAADEAMRRARGFPAAQNYEKRLSSRSMRDHLSMMKSVLRGRPRPPREFWNHITAAEIRRRIPEADWQGFYKFTLERNPWDQSVSRYYWEKPNFGFGEYIRRGLNYKRPNYDIYSINGLPAIDKIVRYENLEEDLTTVQEKIGYPEDIFVLMQDIRAKSSSRKGDGDYRTMYDDETREIVAQQYAREIRLLGYEF